MSDDPADPRFPLGPLSGGAGGMDDAPLLRELQRVLFSGEGPINWELARQIAVAIASGAGGDGPHPTAEGRALEEAVRIAELAVAEATGLSSPLDLPRVEALSRSQWIEANTHSLRPLLDPVGARLSAVMSDAQEQQLGQLGLGSPPDAGASAGVPGLSAGPEGAEFLGALLERMVPLMLGAQVGAVLGDLAQRVLGNFDLAVPRNPGRLLFVVPNIARFERDWSLDPVELRQWVALHEVAHRFEFGRPWVREHVLALVNDLVQHAEIDLSAFERGMDEVDMSNPDAMARMFEGLASPFGHASSDEQRLRIDRVRAFVLASEGYGEHVVAVLGRRMLGSYGRIEEAMRRHREGRHTEHALERLLGLDVVAAHDGLGERFCERVVDQTDEATLSRMWDSAESLPSMPELQEPTLWLSRIA